MHVTEENQRARTCFYFSIGLICIGFICLVLSSYYIIRYQYHEVVDFYKTSCKAKQVITKTPTGICSLETCGHQDHNNMSRNSCVVPKERTVCIQIEVPLITNHDVQSPNASSHTYTILIYIHTGRTRMDVPLECLVVRIHVIRVKILM